MWPIEDGLRRMREQGIAHVGLADFKSLAGIEQFDRVARGLGLEPWLGVTTLVSVPGGLEVPVRLFALSLAGYRRLCQVVSTSFVLPLESLAEPDIGLSLPPGVLSDGRLEQHEWHRHFGWVACELLPGEIEAGRQPISGRLAVPYWPVRYLHASDAPAYRMLCQIGEHPPEDDARPSPGAHQWQALERRLPAFPFDRAPKVLPRTGYHIPTVGASAEEEFAGLRQRAEAGLRQRDLGPARYKPRLGEELTIIRQLGFQGYFLLVAELTDWARSKHIRVGPGRGSAAGSLVAYALGITEVDPLKYGLIFERFLNPERGGLPDIDLDIDYSKRADILEHLRQVWGSSRVAQIGAYGTLASRAALREVGRAQGRSPEEISRAMTVLQVDPTLTLTAQHQVLAEKLRPFDPDGHWLQLAEALEGLPHHASVHAAGVVIAPDSMTNWVPVAADKEPLVTQMEMASVEALGLVKLDVLGLRTLAVVDQVERRLAQQGRQIALQSLPDADPKTLRLLARADTEGVFQLDGHGVKRLLEEMAPRHIREVMAVVALYRPGPMEAIPQYLAGRQRYVPSSPASIEAILSETYGVMVYQEQLMALVRALAGYSWAEADYFRRAVSKRDHQLMAVEEDRLRRRLAERGMEAQAAERWIQRIHAFGNYGFNKSHAAAYGLLAYYVAYLKAHFPLMFWAAELSSLANASDRMVRTLQHVVGLGARLCGPDINASEVGFAPTDDGTGLRAGMDIVRGLGRESAERLVEERLTHGAFADYESYRRRTSRWLDVRAEQALRKAGALITLKGAEEGPEQLSWFANARVPESSMAIDAVTQFGFEWPVAYGPIYFSVKSAPLSSATGQQLEAWAMANPGPHPLILAVSADKGRRMPWTVSGNFLALEELRGYDGIRRVTRQVRTVRQLNEAVWSEEA